MKFFSTTNASRTYKVGGLVFTFEPVTNIGGSWLGVLALEQSSADILAGSIAAIPQISEITEEEYHGLKKKPMSQATLSRGFQAPPTSPRPPEAARLVGPTAGPVPATVKPHTPEAGPGVTLATKTLTVPDELKLETGAKSVTRK